MYTDKNTLSLWYAGPTPETCPHILGTPCAYLSKIHTPSHDSEFIIKCLQRKNTLLPSGTVITNTVRHATVSYMFRPGRAITTYSYLKQHTGMAQVKIPIRYITVALSVQVLVNVV
jgi:hypothetical protein